MDILSEILDMIHLKSSLYFRTSLNGVWGIRVPMYKNVARFHIVANGKFWLEIPETGEICEVLPGELVIIPHGQEHLMRSAPKAKVKILSDVTEQTGFKEGDLLTYGEGEGAITNLICGHFEFEESHIHPIIKTLPPVIHIKNEVNTNFNWINTALDFIDFESVQQEPGAHAIIKRLSEVTFIQAIRVYMKENKKNQIFLTGLNDRYIRISIEKIHAHPNKKWKVEDLARVAGLSRTLYAERFKKLTGLTPGNYITMWRMELAKNLLKEKGQSVAEIAGRLGYDAEEHFQKTFKKWIGQTPSQFRKSF